MWRSAELTLTLTFLQGRWKVIKELLSQVKVKVKAQFFLYTPEGKSERGVWRTDPKLRRQLLQIPFFSRIIYKLCVEV